MTRWSPNPIVVAVRDRIETLLDDASAARRAGHPAVAWRHIEDAHVLSQPWIRPHIRVHLAMLSLGWSQRDGTEIATWISATAAHQDRHGRLPDGWPALAATTIELPQPTIEIV